MKITGRKCLFSLLSATIVMDVMTTKYKIITFPTNPNNDNKKIEQEHE